MKNPIITLASLCLLSLSACDNSEPVFSAQEIETAVNLRDQALEANVAYTVLESLTTEVGPRPAGSAGDQAAVKWAIAKFTELGFDKVYTEPVSVPLWTRGAISAEILAPFPQPMHITSLGHSVGTPDGGIEAEIIHFSTLQDLVDAPEGIAEGKIVYISNRMERAQNGSGYGPAVQARSNGASEAAKKGAVAMFIRSIGTDNHRVPHTGMMRYADGVAKIPAAALSNPDADVLLRQVERGAPVSVAFNMQNEFGGDVLSYNVIGEITGSVTPEEAIIIGGHLDSWDLGTGAIDDGAGVSITMAVGKIIGDMAQAPKRTIRVIAFAAEEIGLYGGRAYATKYADDLDNIIIAAESDFGADRIYAFATNVREEALPATVEIAQVLAPLGIQHTGNQAGGGPDISPLKAAGVAVVNLYQDGTRYFDLHHTADDTFDKVDEAQLSQNVAAYAAFTYLVAQYEGRFNIEAVE